MKDKRSFFERLTGGVNLDDETEEKKVAEKPVRDNGWIEEESEEGELAVDVYQTPAEIVIKSMIAGVRPDDLQVSITRDMVTIRGKRTEERETKEDDYYHKELYWGSFSRSVLLPEEIEPDEAEAVERNGLLVIRLPKIDKKKVSKLRIKSS